MIELEIGTFVTILGIFLGVIFGLVGTIYGLTSRRLTKMETIQEEFQKEIQNKFKELIEKHNQSCKEYRTDIYTRYQTRESADLQREPIMDKISEIEVTLKELSTQLKDKIEQIFAAISKLLEKQK